MPAPFPSLAPAGLTPLVCAGLCAWLAAAPAPARADHLVPVGDVDGDDASEVLLVTDLRLILLDGPALEVTLWELELPIGQPQPVIAMAGDLDGDGLADFALGFPSPTGPGRVAAVFGARADSGLVGGRVQWLEGDSPGDGFGASLAATDLDGDGRSELAITAPGRRAPGGFGFVGLHRVLGDGPFAELEPLPSDGFWGFAGLGALTRVFDRDGDGLSDLLIADGPAHWRLGWSSTPPGLALFPEPHLGSAPLGLGDLDGDGRADVTFSPPTNVTDDLPFVPVSYSPAGDFDGDLVTDVLVSGTAQSALVLGGANAHPARVAELSELSAAGTAHPGARAYPLGDVDGDGLADLGLLPASETHPSDLGPTPTPTVIRGRAALLGGVALLVRLAEDPTPAPSPTLALAAGPDLDRDGHRGDLLVGWPTMDAPHRDRADRPIDGGALFVLPGGPGTPGLDPVSHALTLAPAEWPSHDGAELGAAVAVGTSYRTAAVLVGVPGYNDPAPDSGNFVLRGVTDAVGNLGLYQLPQRGSRLGESVALLGDFDGDGLGEAAVASPVFAPSAALPAAGQVAIYGSGPNGRPNNTPSWRLEGNRVGLGLGRLFAPGDLDGDGRADLAIGLPSAGEVLLAFLPLADAKVTRRVLADPAPPISPASPPSPDEDLRFGAIMTAGDLDGDGHPELVVAAPARSALELYRSDGSASMSHVATFALPAPDGGALTLAATDLDGDGRAELIVGRPDAARDASGSLTAEGRVDVLRWVDGALAPTPAETFFGGRVGARLGLALAALDRNEDHRGDLAIAFLDRGSPMIQIRLGGDGARAHPLALRVENLTGDDNEPWSHTLLRDRAFVRVAPGGPYPGRHAVQVELTQIGSARAAGPAPSPSPDRIFHRGERVVGSDEAGRVQIDDLPAGTGFRVRARLHHPASESPLQPSTRWHSAHVHLPPGVDLRTYRNAAPVALGDRFRVRAGATRIPIDHLLDNDYDLDNDAFALVDFTAPTHGTLRRDGDALVYEPADGTPRESHFAYRLRDVFGLVGREATVVLSVADCKLAECRDGRIGGTLEMPNGALAGFACRVRYDLDPPRLDCDLDAEGRLELGARSCGPIEAQVPPRDASPP